jgi:WD40 repeat protein
MNACPFPGLLPFQERDAPFFFGRDREIAELLSRLRSQRFLGVVGVSGSGKSSLVHAGVKPELRAQGWRIVDVRPGSAPAVHLAAGLSVELPGPDWAGLLRGSSYGLSDGIRDALAPHAGTRLLVIVDQFEEIFDFRESDAEGADLFVQQLLRAASLPGLPAYVLITMRTDFLGKCALFRNLPETLNEGSYLVPRLTRKEQEEVIKSPLLVSGVGIEPVVVDQLLNASETNRDELPVLQHLLKVLWEVSGGTGPITEAHLAEAGGWDDAIRRDADGLFDPLSQNEKDAIRLVFRRLTKKGTGDRPLRTPCSLAELVAISRTLVTPQRLLEVMDEFRKRDLLVWETEDRIDIPHECLTCRWKALAGWIEEEDRDRQLLDFIAASKRGNLPLAGFKLDEGLGVRSRLAAPEWAARYGHDSRELAGWIHSSADRQKREARKRQYVVVVLVGATLLFAGLSWWALFQRHEAEKNRNAAAKTTAELIVANTEVNRQAQQTAAANTQLREKNKDLAQAVEAEGRARSETGLQRILSVWQSAARQAASDAVDHSDDDRSALLARQALLFYHVTPDKPRYLLVENALQMSARHVVFSHVLSGHQAPVNSVAFSPDGAHLASASNDGTVRIWNLRQPQTAPQVLSGHQSIAPSVAFSPDGARLASASDDGAVRIWDLRQPQAAPRVLSGPKSFVTSVAFSPDGAHLASSGDMTVRIWDLRQPQTAPRVLSGHESIVTSVAFSPDGARLASASGDSTVRIWDLRQSQAAPQVLSGHQNSVNSVAFSPDGARLASASGDGTVRIWDLRQSRAAPQVLSGHRLSVNSVAFSRDGTRLASAGGDGTVRIWDLRQPQAAVQVLSGHQSFVNSVAFSPDGSHLASTGSDTTVRIWDLRHPQAEPQVLSGHQSFVRSVAFSPDGAHLASASGDTTVLIWDLRQPQDAPQALSGHQNSVTSVAFSPDGARLASASYDRTVRIWDLRHHHAAPQVLSGHQYSVTTVAFSPDGARLASASDDAVRIWDLRHPQDAPQILSGHQAPVTSVAFSPDGVRLASASEDMTVRIWPLWTAAADYLCGRVWRNLSNEEWRLYIGEGIPYERTCPNLPAGAGAPR